MKTMETMSNQKDFKYTLKTKGGKILFQTIVAFGSKHHPFPNDWKENVLAQTTLQDYKKTFLKDNIDVEISENLDFGI